MEMMESSLCRVMEDTYTHLVGVGGVVWVVDLERERRWSSGKCDVICFGLA